MISTKIDKIIKGIHKIKSLYQNLHYNLISHIISPDMEYCNKASLLVIKPFGVDII